jgi:hypothetical protein
VKTGRTYLQLSGLATIAILLFGVFRPANAAPQEKGGAASQQETAQGVTANLAPGSVSDSTSRTTTTTPSRMPSSVLMIPTRHSR